jgi:hypothetical protein
MMMHCHDSVLMRANEALCGAHRRMKGNPASSFMIVLILHD